MRGGLKGATTTNDISDEYARGYAAGMMQGDVPEEHRPPSYEYASGFVAGTRDAAALRALRLGYCEIQPISEAAQILTEYTSVLGEIAREGILWDRTPERHRLLALACTPTLDMSDLPEPALCGDHAAEAARHRRRVQAARAGLRAMVRALIDLDVLPERAPSCSHGDDESATDALGISVTYSAPTDYRGARLIVRCDDLGAVRVWDDALSDEENYEAAAMDMLARVAEEHDNSARWAEASLVRVRIDGFTGRVFAIIHPGSLAPQNGTEGAEDRVTFA